MGKKKGKYAGKRKWFDKKTLWWLLAFPLWLGVMILEGRPSLQPLRDSMAYSIVWKTAISGVVLYFAYFTKKKQPLGGKIILSAIACIPWLSVIILSYRIRLLILVLLQYVSIGYQVYYNLKRHKNNMVLLCATMMLVILVLIESAESYTFVENSNGLQYWPISLSVMAVVTAAVAVLVFKGYWYLKDDRKSEKIALCFCAALLSFLLTEFTLCHVNYIFDTSEPTVYELTIGEKEIETHSKSGSDYILIVGRNDQKIEMEVSQSEYYQYEVGDKLPVTLYKGFFSDAYYIVE